MQTRCRWAVAACATIMAAALTPVASLGAQESVIAGYTIGCFSMTQGSCAGVNVANGSYQSATLGAGLQYNNATFNKTTFNLAYALGGNAMAGMQNVNNLGSFQFTSGSGTVAPGTFFNLYLVINSDPAINEFTPVGGVSAARFRVFSATVTGSAATGFGIDFLDTGAQNFTVGANTDRSVPDFTFQFAPTSVSISGVPGNVKPVGAFGNSSGGLLVAQAVVPEPATVGMVLMGLAGIAGIARRKRAA